MKKLLIINSIYGQGSTGRLCRQIEEALNVEYEFCFAYGMGPDGVKNGKRTAGTLSVKFHAFLARYFCRLGYYSFIPTLRLIKLIRREKPDLVHLNNIHDWFINFKMLFRFLKKSKIEILWTFHDCWAFTGGCFHFTENGCYKWKTACSHCEHKKDFCSSHIISDVKKPFSDKKKFFPLDNVHISVVSEWLNSVVKESFFKDNEIMVIPNCIDTDIFKPNRTDYFEKYGLKDKFIILGVAGYWGKGKKLESFFELSKRIDNDSAIVLVGLNEGQKTVVKEYGNVLALDAVNDDVELACIYSSANVLINFSIEETFGLVVAEALSCGTPAIVFDSTACPELVKKGCGFVLATHSDVLPAITEIKKNGKDSYSERCRESIVNNYSIEKITRLYSVYYDHILSGAGKQ